MEAYVEPPILSIDRWVSPHEELVKMNVDMEVVDGMVWWVLEWYF